MNATQTPARRQRKPRTKPARSIRLCVRPSAETAGVVRITVGKDAQDYLLTEFRPTSAAAFWSKRSASTRRPPTTSTSTAPSGLRMPRIHGAFALQARRRAGRPDRGRPAVATRTADGAPTRPPLKGASVLLRHATPRRNLPGVSRDGLLCSKAAAGCRSSGFTRRRKRRGPCCTPSSDTAAAWKVSSSSKWTCRGAGCVGTASGSGTAHATSRRSDSGG